jgi:hypothetical protein
VITKIERTISNINIRIEMQKRVWAAMFFYRSPLKGQPIETPAPAEARKQPTPTDAVMAVLKKQGEDTTPSALVPGVTNAVHVATCAAARTSVGLFPLHRAVKQTLVFNAGAGA